MSISDEKQYQILPDGTMSEIGSESLVKYLEAKLASALEREKALIECLNNVMAEFKDADWDCSRCGFNPEIETCNAAYIIADALASNREARKE